MNCLINSIKLIPTGTFPIRFGMLSAEVIVRKGDDDFYFRFVYVLSTMMLLFDANVINLISKNNQGANYK